MKIIQVRRNILTGRYEVQAKEKENAKWQKVTDFATKEEAEKFAATPAKNVGDKQPKPKKKRAKKQKKA